MSIQALTTLIPPPASPIQTQGDWSTAEQELEVTFPADFKQLIQTYGTGEFFNDLAITNPLRDWGIKGIREDLATYRELREACEYTYPLFPESPGLFPWGSDQNGHLYCWWTEGEPDDWKIVQLFHGYEDDPLEIVAGPITQFLMDFVQNKHTNMLGGNEWTPEQYCFSVGIPGIQHGDD